MRMSRTAPAIQPLPEQPYAASPLPDNAVFKLGSVHLAMTTGRHDTLKAIHADVPRKGGSSALGADDSRSLAEFFDLTSTEPRAGEHPAPGPPCAVKPQGSLRGQVILVRRDRIEGWAYDGEGAVELAVMDNRRVIGYAQTGQYEKMPAGCEGIDERYVFSFMIPEGLAPDIRHLIEVVRAKDFCELPGSPRILEKE